MESEHQVIPRRTQDGPAPLSFAQQRLWFLDRLVPNSPFYNLANIVRLPYLPNPAILEAAVQEIVRRHEVLRTRFTLLDGEPVQTVDPSWSLPLRLVDLSAMPDSEQHQALTTLANEEARRPFDLFTGPLLRVTLVQLGAQESVFLSTMHHIVGDGWSSFFGN
jgi:condensation domain-containing protein